MIDGWVVVFLKNEKRYSVAKMSAAASHLASCSIIGDEPVYYPVSTLIEDKNRAKSIADMMNRNTGKKNEMQQL